MVEFRRRLAAPQHGDTDLVRSVQHDVEDPNKLTVVHDFATMDDVNRYMSLPNLKELMEKVGLIGEPEIWVTEKVL